MAKEKKKKVFYLYQTIENQRKYTSERMAGTKIPVVQGFCCTTKQFIVDNLKKLGYKVVSARSLGFKLEIKRELLGKLNLWESSIY